MDRRAPCARRHCSGHCSVVLAVVAWPGNSRAIGRVASGSPGPDRLEPAVRKRVEVAAAVIFDPAGRFLLAQRPAGRVYQGYWEFPGGKVEAGETAAEALVRELHEELGIVAGEMFPWLTRDYDYEHAAVRLRFFRVMSWSGQLHGRENQAFAWQQIGNVSVAPLLPANGPILRALDLPFQFGITCAGAMGTEPFLDRLDAALRGGLRLIQVREKELTDAALVDFSTQVVSMAHRCGARVIINGSTTVARKAGADGVHLTSTRLMALDRRPGVEWCGASCHSAIELERARILDLDYALLGPVLATPSHPGAPWLGWERFGEMIRDYPLPVYALGGLRLDDRALAWSRGAHGVAMVRGAWGL